MSDNPSESTRKLIPSMKPFFPEQDIKELSKGFEDILRSGQLTSGKYTKEFEEAFARYIGVKHAIAANSGTATLQMIYTALDVRGKEVITPTNTYIATSNAVIFSGGKPVLADIDASSLCIDVEDAFSKVTKNTKVMVVVHIAGLIHPRIDEIRERCDKQGIILVEDAAHAHGAAIGNRKAGSLSRAASFSFYPAKPMTTMEGGMVTTDDDQIDQVSRELRNHGKGPNGLHVKVGFNWRMVEINSLIGLQQLRRLDEILEKKAKIAKVYESALADQELMSLIKVPDGTRHSYYKYPVTLAKSVNVEKVQLTLKNKYRVENGTIYYPPCHLEPVYRELFGYKPGDMPVSEDVLKRTVALPIYADMDPQDASYAAESLIAAIKES